MKADNQKDYKIEFVKLTVEEKDALSKCYKCSYGYIDECAPCGPREGKPDGYYVLENGKHVFHELTKNEQKEFDKCVKYNCYYNQDGTPDCPDCFSFQRRIMNDGYFKRNEIKS